MHEVRTHGAQVLGRAWALLLLAPLVLLVAACGDTVSIDPVAKAADVSVAQTSEHVELSARVTQGLQTISMAGSGDFSNRPNLGRLTMTVTGPRRATMQAVLTGTRIYLTSDLFRGRLPDGKTWMSLDFGKAGKALGIDMSAMGAQAPSSTLAQLKASGKVTTVGHATIGGVATTHYSAVVDLDRLAKVSKALHVDVSYAPIDVWVDGKGLVRRMHMSYIQGAHDAVPETVTDMTMTLSRYGEHVSVQTPAAYDTFDATELATGLLKK